MAASIGLWPKPDQLHDIPRAILASVKAQIAALLPGEMEVVRVPAEDMRWLLWESKQLRTIGGDPRDAEIAALKAEVERLTAGQHRCEWCAETFPLVPRQMSEPAVDRGVCPQCKVERFRRDLAAHKRALADGPASLRWRGPMSGEEAARNVERAQAAAMKEEP